MMLLDNWNVVLNEGWDSHQGPIFINMFVVTWLFIGNFLLLSLFQAILLDKFEKRIREYYEEENYTKRFNIKQDNYPSDLSFSKRKVDRKLLSSRADIVIYRSIYLHLYMYIFFLKRRYFQTLS